MYTNNRDAYRQTFFITWQKHQKKLPLEPVEMQLLAVMLLHPEYHSLLDHPDSFQQEEFELEENPFFHMSLHLAIREQISSNRPHGIKQLHQHLLSKYENNHTVEHHMMTCLAKIMWSAQQNGAMPNDQEYLEKLKAI